MPCDYYVKCNGHMHPVCKAGEIIDGMWTDMKFHIDFIKEYNIPAENILELREVKTREEIKAIQDMWDERERIRKAEKEQRRLERLAREQRRAERKGATK